MVGTRRLELLTIFEVATGKRVHTAQYILVGISQMIFYLLLLSFAERIGFDSAS
jgi:inner membrane protein